MGNGGEERDISATQGEERGGDVKHTNVSSDRSSLVSDFHGEVNPTRFRREGWISVAQLSLFKQGRESSLLLVPTVQT